jgi:cell wall-associated NlpC family hydrolase
VKEADMRATARTKPTLASGVRVVTALAVCTAIWSGASPAKADPITDKQAEAARLAADLQQQGLHAERLSERANLARIRAEQVEVQLDATRAVAADLDQQLETIAQLVRTQAVESYINSGRQVSLGFDGSGGPVGPLGVNEFIQRQAYASIIVEKENGALRTLGQVRRQAAEAERQLISDQQLAAASLKELSADQQAAAAAAAAQQATLNRVKGDLAALVRAKQAELAAEQAARVRAELAARAAARAAALAAARSGGAGGLGGRPGASAGTGSLPPSNPGVPARGWEIALDYARAQLGKPYQWGGAGPNSFDCSGLTMMAWGAAGVSLPHLAQAQYAMTRRVPLTDLKPGDLIFFGTPTDVHHEGIYVSDGNMIDAPHTGDVVKYSTIYWDDLLAAGRVEN